MITPVMKRTDTPLVGVKLGKASFPAPFISGLEYAAPARGTWNIVHIGMLVPEAHEIFVCAAGCLRGVVLTAAEMGAAERFSTITVRENNVLEGGMENFIIDGVSDILKKLPKTPPAILVYTSCIHHFIGCDLNMVYRTLRERFPNVAFTDCYMTPTMRKSGLTPDQTMRKQLYSLLEKRTIDNNFVNIIGNNTPTDESSELVKMIQESGHQLRDITLCKNYSEYLKLAESAANISYLPVARAGGETLEERLGQKHFYLPLCYGYEEITANLELIAEYLGIKKPDFSENIHNAEMALKKAYKVIGNVPIAIDYTAVPRPLSLARLLAEHGFNIKSVYADSFIDEEEADFKWLAENRPDIEIFPTVQVQMRILPRTGNEKLLAIGQKAAYFGGTDNFVNIVEGGGMYGFNGICRMAELITDAFLKEKDAKSLIQIKGLGCGCCL